MATGSLIIPVLLLAPPPLAALCASWFAIRPSEKAESEASFSFRAGAWTTVGVALIYFGALSALAVINLVRGDNAVSMMMATGIGVIAASIPTPICLGGYALSCRVFGRVGQG